MFGCVRFLGNSSVFSKTRCFRFENYLYLAVRLGRKVPLTCTTDLCYTHNEGCFIYCFWRSFLCCCHVAKGSNLVRFPRHFCDCWANELFKQLYSIDYQLVEVFALKYLRGKIHMKELVLMLLHGIYNQHQALLTYSSQDFVRLLYKFYLVCYIRILNLIFMTHIILLLLVT